MSWFDKLFGEDNDSNEDILRNKNKRRQATQSNDSNHDSLLPQNNDIYHRPKGKFRFPINGFESENVGSEYTSVNDGEQSYVKNDDNETLTSQESKRHRRRRNHANDDEYVNSSRQSNSNKTRRKQVTNPYVTKSTHRQISPTSLGDNKSNNGATSSKSQPRMKLQSERFKSNYKTQPEYTYHKSDFKASEVPSAIFGTMKRRPIENGMIPPKDNEEETNNKMSSNVNHSSDNDGYTAERSQSNFRSNQQSNDVKETSTNSNSKHDENINQQTSSVGDEKAINSTPNHSTKDNTININNIYASQIVEEIRRERERKVLQKRRFKKALQEKRQQNKETNEDSIQKAIDEMYAKQAQQYVGESSLDMESQDDSNAMIDEHDNNETINQTDAIENSDLDQQETSHYNYEEIDLSDIKPRHQVNDDDVTVTDVTEQDEGSETTDTNYVSSQSIYDDRTTTVQKDSESSQSDSTISSENAKHHYSDKTSISENEDNNIDDADYRELDDSEQPTTYSTSEHTSSSLYDSETSQLNDHKHLNRRSGHNAVTQSVDHETEYAKKRNPHIQDSNLGNSDKTMSTSESVLESDESLSDSFISNNSNETSEFVASSYDNTQNLSSSENSYSESINDNQSESSDQKFDKVNSENKGVETNQHLHSEQTSKPLKGSKPFNVVMTPSDKKRMIDKKKSRTVHVPNLTPERQSNSTQSNNIKQASSEQYNTSEHSESNQQSNNISESEAPSADRTNELNQTTYESDSNSTVSEHSLSPNDVVNNENVQMAQSDYNVGINQNMEDDSSSMQHASNDVNENDSDNRNEDKRENTHASTSKVTSGEVDNNNENIKVQKPTIRKGPNINLPSMELLESPEPHEVNEEWIDDKKQELNDALYYFNVPAEVQNVTEGPSVTRFELSVEKGVKVSRITALQDDIKMALAAKDIRIEAPIPGTSLVGIEVPNQNPAKVNLRSIVDSDQFKNAESKLTVAMGYRINNEPLLMDIAKTPHALIAGATGSGKSVCINSILMSLLYKNHPEELRLLLIDPKMVELAPYNDLPHLVSPVITDVKAATQSLKWAVEEMERRYKLFAQYHVRNITAFNKKASYEQRMPKIVIVIDELADLMMMAPQEVEQSIARIAQKARACGIHMLVATQRPSVNVITGLIKANIPTRIAFMVSSSVDSRTILDSGGAERLLGYGDMLYLGGGMNKPIRVQGTFVSDEEIDDVVDFIKQQREPDYLFEEKELLKKTQTQAQDDLFDDVCEFMINEGHISTSLVQRHFQIGYNRAARIIDQLEQLGYISGANGSKPRDVYITEADLNQD